MMMDDVDNLTHCRHCGEIGDKRICYTCLQKSAERLETEADENWERAEKAEAENARLRAAIAMYECNMIILRAEIDADASPEELRACVIDVINAFPKEGE